MPGITVGDIGPKYGYNTKDNGFLMFNHYRIPRENMLMRYAKVNKGGEFQKALNEKVAYATMMAVRTAILKASFSYLAMGLNIAVRYSLKRT
jgi:acyl-CoA oxidase